MTALIGAFPAYPGSKRKLWKWIFCTLNKVMPFEYWRHATFIDAFAGGGTVSLFAKAQGFGHVHCNDWSERSQFIFQGLLANQQTLLTAVDLLMLFQPIENELSGYATPLEFAARWNSTNPSDALRAVI